MTISDGDRKQLGKPGNAAQGAKSISLPPKTTPQTSQRHENLVFRACQIPRKPIPSPIPSHALLSLEQVKVADYQPPNSDNQSQSLHSNFHGS
jgi:hypothetical protein